MIQLIKTKLIPTHKSENEQLFSKEQLKTAAKVMGLVTVSLFAVRAIYDYQKYNKFKDILAWHYLPSIYIPGFIYKNLSEEGIAFLHPSNIGKRIFMCSFSGCFVKERVFPWNVIFINSIYSSIRILKDEVLKRISRK